MHEVLWHCHMACADSRLSCTVQMLVEHQTYSQLGGARRRTDALLLCSGACICWLHIPGGFLGSDDRIQPARRGCGPEANCGATDG